MLIEDLEQVYLNSLEGLGSSYRMKGYFVLKRKDSAPLKIPFEGVAFGGNYGGHNVSVSLAEDEKKLLGSEANVTQIDDLLTEIQRRLLNNEMIVEYDQIKPEEHGDLEGFGKI
jgi:hypothetical protein